MEIAGAGHGASASGTGDEGFELHRGWLCKAELLYLK